MTTLYTTLHRHLLSAIQHHILCGVSFFPPFGYFLSFSKMCCERKIVLTHHCFFSTLRSLPAFFLVTKKEYFFQKMQSYYKDAKYGIPPQKFGCYSSPLAECLTHIQQKKKASISDISFFESATTEFSIRFIFDTIPSTSLYIFMDAAPRAYLVASHVEKTVLSCGSTAPFTGCDKLIFKKSCISYPPCCIAEEDYFFCLQQQEHEKRRKEHIVWLQRQIRNKQRQLDHTVQQQTDKYTQLCVYKKRLHLLPLAWTSFSKEKREYSIVDPYTGRPLTLHLVESKSLQEDIAYTAKSIKKMKKSLDIFLPQQKDKYTQEISSLEQQLHYFEKAATYEECLLSMKLRQKESAPIALLNREKEQRDIKRFVSEDGYVIFLGTTAQVNDLLTFSYAKRYDIWLHINHGSGPHVIIKMNNENIPPPKSTLYLAGQIAAWFSLPQNIRHKHCNSCLEVIYTQRKNLFKRKGMQKGHVGCRSTKSIFVKPNKDDIDKARKLFEAMPSHYEKQP